MNDLLKPPIFILSGKENVGKSTFCRKILEYTRTRNINVSGIISELVIVNDQKRAINSLDIRSCEKINLAVYSPGWDPKKRSANGNLIGKRSSGAIKS